MTDKNKQISEQITKEDEKTIDWESVGYILDSMAKLITASEKVVNEDRLLLEEDLERLRNSKSQRGKLLAEYNKEREKGDIK